jgi:hypothetical protein
MADIATDPREIATSGRGGATKFLDRSGSGDADDKARAAACGVVEGDDAVVGFDDGFHEA